MEVARITNKAQNSGKDQSKRLDDGEGGLYK
jgi:hypothetical protein